MELPDPGFEMPEETGSTYRENALLKAEALCRSAAAPAVGDDSGIEVEALGGRPGIRSARYAPTDAERVERLLGELGDVDAPGRSAIFRCVLALVLPDGRRYTVDGACGGSIAFTPRGARGFGYDPIFVPSGDKRTFAEMNPVEKNAQSHRGRAAMRFAALLRGLVSSRG